MISRSLLHHTLTKLATHHLRRLSHKFPPALVQSQPQFNRFHTCVPFSAKLFPDNENHFAHDVLQKTNLYTLFEGLDLTLQQDPITEEIENILSPSESHSPADTFSDFKKIATFCRSTETCITDERFDQFVKVFITQCQHFSDDQLRECLRYLSLFPETPGINARNFVDIWSALDKVCIKKMEQWSTKELLLMSDYWYGLNLAKASDFVWESLRKIGRKVRKLSPQEMVHTMFFCNVIRKSLYEMFDFEVRLDQCIDELSLQEIGVMSMGFFKTQTRIRNPGLIEKIYRRLMAGMDTVEDITFVNILKVLRYSTKVPQASLLIELLDKTCPQIERISLLGCLHVALMGVDIQLFHAKSFELIADRFNKEIDQCRLKDMERLTLVISQCNLCETYAVARELCEKILVRIKDKVDEIIRHPKCFVNCLHYLTICGYYDEELLSGALDEKFFKHAYGENLKVTREIFQLDSFIRINLKSKYNGHKLQDKTRKTMGKLLVDYIPERSPKYRLNLTDRILLEVKESCEHLYRPCHLKHVLPHFRRADVVISYNKSQKQSLPLSTTCPKDYSGIILSRDLLLEENVEDISTVVIVVAGWNNYVRDTNRLTGLLQLKLDQLSLLQHKVLVVPWFDWRSLETAADKQDYLKRNLLPLL